MTGLEYRQMIEDGLDNLLKDTREQLDKGLPPNVVSGAWCLSMLEEAQTKHRQIFVVSLLSVALVRLAQYERTKDDTRNPIEP